MTVIDNKLFMIGGRDDSRPHDEYSEAVDKTKSYNLRTKKWEIKSPMKISRRYVFKCTIPFFTRSLRKNLLLNLESSV